METQLVSCTRRKHIGNQIGQILNLQAFQNGVPADGLRWQRLGSTVRCGTLQPQVSRVVVPAAYGTAVLGYLQPAALHTGLDALSDQPPG